MTFLNNDPPETWSVPRSLQVKQDQECAQLLYLGKSGDFFVYSYEAGQLRWSEGGLPRTPVTIWEAETLRELTSKEWMLVHLDGRPVGCSGAPGFALAGLVAREQGWYGTSLRLKHFVCGFVLGFIPLLLLGLYRDNDTESAFMGAGIGGLIYGGLSAVFGRPMLEFLSRDGGGG